MTLITVDQYGGLVPKGLHVKIYCDMMQDGIDKKKEIVSALKLQELVKERLKGTGKCGYKRFSDETGYLAQEFRSLIEQSENTVKERGSGDKA